MKPFAFVVCLLFARPFMFGADEGFESEVASFLRAHCVKCHGPEKQKGRIRYDKLEGFRPEDTHLWTLVHEQLSSGEMPPEDEARPDAGELKKALAWIEKEQAAVTTGRTRRLNRRELSAALQDLTGLPVDYAHGLPADGKIDGFDTGADGLHDAADSVAGVMEVTRRAVNVIRFLEPSPSQLFKGDFAAAKEPRRAIDHWKERNAYVKVRGNNLKGEGLLLDPKWLGDRDSSLYFNLVPPEDGKGVVRFKVKFSVFKTDFEGIPDPVVWTKVASKALEYLPVSGPVEKTYEREYFVQYDDLPVTKRGLGFGLTNRVETPYEVEGFKNEDRSRKDKPLPGGTGLYRPFIDNKQNPKPTWDAKPYPYVLLREVEAEMNYVAQWPPASWKADLGEITDSLDSAKKLLALWTDRAWRRPSSEKERVRYLAFYQDLRKKNLSFDDALRGAFRAVLLSGPFRYLPDVTDPDRSKADHAVATRLAFMLHGAPPDDELRRLAAEGKIRRPEVLAVQVKRLLADPKSENFFRPFVLQWLEMEQPITLVQPSIQHQTFRFGRILKESMRQETLRYVRQLFVENRPAKELVQSGWTLMDGALGRHYGYPEVKGHHFRKVHFRKGDKRGGGILGHAGIQSMLTWMGDNWVVYRGAWALRHVLDDPPPPPPLEVPELDLTANENKGKTFRELLKQHQEDPNCSLCHAKMDPLGFAFQNFDLSGRWRDEEHESYKREELDGKIAWNGAGKARPVDAVGSLPRGETFRSFAECKDLIVTHYQEDLVRGILKNLVLYSTGNKADVAAMARIRTILARRKAAGLPLRDVLADLLSSPTFLEK